MQEKLTPKLEDHRFNISAESMTMMKEMRETFLELKEKFPEIKAVSFWGSRTRGKEKPGSDLDTVVFTDEDAMPAKQGLVGLYRENRLDDIIEATESSLKDFIKKTNVPFNLHLRSFSVDESDLRLYLYAFKRTAEKGLDNFNEVTNATLAITSLFFISIGDIYKLREKVLNNFEEDTNGEVYYQLLIKNLRNLERPQNSAKAVSIEESVYEYPKTLAEGKKYFLSHKQV